MIRNPAKTISIAAGHGGAPLSKTQKAFNALVRQIGKKRVAHRSFAASGPLTGTSNRSAPKTMFPE